MVISASSAWHDHRRLVVAGVIMSSVVLGGAGIALRASSPSVTGTPPTAVDTAAMEQAAQLRRHGGVDRDLGLSDAQAAGRAAASIDPVTGRPAGHGMLRGIGSELGTGEAVASGGSTIDPATGRPQGSGPLRQ